MNERGFFTIIGLCLLLVAAIFIKGVNEFEANYSRGILNFQIEHELQNAADSALIDASKKIPAAEDFVQFNIPVSTPSVSDRLKNFNVKVYGERSKMVTQKFSRATNKINPKEPNFDAAKRVTVIISVASCDSPFIEGKMYRQASAYIFDDDENTEEDEAAIIHFLSEFDQSISKYF